MTGGAARRSGAVAAELRAYGDELAAAAAAQVDGSFTDVPEADALVKQRPEAFLIGVLFTQGIPAERAWAAPYLLMNRLGHLDLARLAAEPEAVAEAVARRPSLHRFKNTMGGWVSEAARRVLLDWDGDASRIWAPGTHVRRVNERLSAFSGIGRKKAAMAVEILVRHFGVQLAGIEAGTVAYDVHVRRVFLRSGLAEEDTPDAISAAAAAANPAAPGLLDLPAWLIGREHCRPREPRCAECRLGRACPRRERDVVGVAGSRRPSV